MLVESLTLDVMVCITSCRVVPLILAGRRPDVLGCLGLSAITNCKSSMVEFRAAPEVDVAARLRLEENAVCFDNG